VDAIDSDALVVVELTANDAPKVVGDGADQAFEGGHRAGVAYAFDRQSGELRCAGRFEARSSDSVAVLSGGYGALGNESESLQRDFEAQVDREIAKALRVVDPANRP
jgi:hypothetical protein